MQLDKTAQRLLSGKTPFFACTEDPRFSFCLYIPTAHSFEGPRIPVLVVVHGTRRQVGGYINRLKDFSERHGVAVLCPLFPAGIIDPTDVHNYKNVLYRGIRFDEVLLAMLSQASRLWRIDTGRFYLHGYSGGGQFAHRFLYLHAERLRAVSIGAPGSITRPGTDAAWPGGLADVERVLGVVPDWDAVARVPVQVVVGSRDVGTDMIATDERGAGRTRLERARTLHGDLVGLGAGRCELTVVEDVGHDGLKCLSAVESWLIRTITAT